MKKPIIAIILCVMLFFSFNVWAQSDNSLKFKVDSAAVTKGKNTIKMNMPLFKIGNEHYVSMEFLSKNLDGIEYNVKDDEVTFGIKSPDSGGEKPPPESGGGDKEDPKKDANMSFVSFSHWTSDVTGFTFIFVSFKNIGKSTVKDLVIPVTVEDNGVVEYEVELKFCGMLEPGQYYSDTIVVFDGLELSSKTKILYSFKYKTVTDKNPTFAVSGLKMEKDGFSVKLKGQIANKSKNDYLLYVFASFFAKDGEKLSICCVGEAEIKSFKAGKTYSFTAEDYPESSLLSKINHYELSYCFLKPQSLANVKSAHKSGKTAGMTLKNKLLGMFGQQ